MGVRACVGQRPPDPPWQAHPQVVLVEECLTYLVSIYRSP
jgi:hypothetical protein